MKKHFIQAISFFLTAWLMGCGGKPEATPKLYTVTISQMQFRPSEIKVAKGDSVLF